MYDDVLSNQCPWANHHMRSDSRAVTNDCTELRIGSIYFPTSHSYKHVRLGGFNHFVINDQIGEHSRAADIHPVANYGVSNECEMNRKGSAQHDRAGNF